MVSFAYRGRDATGRAVEGVQDGATSGAVADTLLARGITPLTIRQTQESAPAPAAGVASRPLQLFKPKVRHIDVLLFSRQIHTLLKAGVPIMRALAGLQDSNTNIAMKQVLQEVRESLDSGRELSVSLARHPNVFSPFYLSMVRIGEMTGRLEDVFIRLSEQMEFEQFMREQVKTALRYPAFVVTAMIIGLFVVNIFVIPSFAHVFKGFNAQLPLLTRWLIAFSHFMVVTWPVLVVAMAAAFFGFRSWIATAAGAFWWDKTKLSIPVAGKIVRKATLARFAHSFAMSAKSGVPIIQALGTVAMTVDNHYMARKVDDMREGVERGESISRVARNAGVFTPTVLQMIAVGEESGAIDDMMQEIADMYQNEVQYELKTLSQQIEPIMITLLGIMVLILALGIFLPIWNLSQVALKK